MVKEDRRKTARNRREGGRSGREWRERRKKEEKTVAKAQNIEEARV